MADREADRSGEAAPHAPADGEQPPSPDAADRAAVEAEYDFADFRPADMARMSREEWELAFDPDTWITGPELLDRVAAELRRRVVDGQLFAVVERHTAAGEPRLLAYTDTDYAVVHPDGTVEGTGGIQEEVEPVVALCAMDDFDVAEPPADAGLPHPETVTPGSGALGHRLLLVIAAVQIVAGLVLFLSPLVVSLGPGTGVLTAVLGLGFLGIGLALGVIVANARLSDRFRAADYRARLRAAGVGSDARPPFLPTFDGQDDPVDGSEEGAT